MEEAEKEIIATFESSAPGEQISHTMQSKATIHNVRRNIHPETRFRHVLSQEP